MQPFKIIPALFIFSIFCSCTSVIDTSLPHTKYEKAQFGKQYAPSEMKKELDFLFNTIAGVHPDICANIDSATLIKKLKSTADNFTVSLDRLEFYKRTAPLVALLKDGHTSLWIPAEEWSAFINSGGTIFPLRLDYDENDGLFSKFNYTPLISGDKLLKINNMNADSLLNVFSLNVPAERDLRSRKLAAGNFAYFLWLYKISAPFKVTFQSRGNGIMRDAFISEKQIKSDSNTNPDKNNQGNSAPYFYNYLPEGIAYINFSSMQNIGVINFENFLNNTFQDIKEKHAKGLIIDIRNNGGGSSFYADMLLSFITNKPYRLSGGVDRKSSSQYKEFAANMLPWYLRWLTFKPFILPISLFTSDTRLFTARNGDVFHSSVDVEVPNRNPLLFDGKVCVLIGNRTFSSAVELANGIEDYKLAVLIGEETGGVPNSFGDLYVFDLPATQLQVGVSTARFIRANGDITNKHGVIPDYYVKQKYDDTLLGLDSVIEFAKKWILNSIPDSK